MIKNKKKLLIIEDDAYIVQVYNMVFKDLDADFEVEENGKEGFMKIKRDQPDLVLMDSTLPGMAGEEILQALKNDSSLSDVPVVIMSNKDKEALEKIAAYPNVKETFMKVELNIDGLLACVKKFL